MVALGKLHAAQPSFAVHGRDLPGQAQDGAGDDPAEEIDEQGDGKHGGHADAEHDVELAEFRGPGQEAAVHVDDAADHLAGGAGLHRKAHRGVAEELFAGHGLGVEKFRKGAAQSRASLTHLLQHPPVFHMLLGGPEPGLEAGTALVPGQPGPGQFHGQLPFQLVRVFGLEKDPALVVEIEAVAVFGGPGESVQGRLGRSENGQDVAGGMGVQGQDQVAAKRFVIVQHRGDEPEDRQAQVAQAGEGDGGREKQVDGAAWQNVARPQLPGPLGDDEGAVFHERRRLHGDVHDLAPVAQQVDLLPGVHPGEDHFPVASAVDRVAAFQEVGQGGPVQGPGGQDGQLVAAGGEERFDLMGLGQGQDDGVAFQGNGKIMVEKEMAGIAGDHQDAHHGRDHGHQQFLPDAPVGEKPRDLGTIFVFLESHETHGRRLPWRDWRTAWNSKGRVRD
ncbi:hypothetical protein ASZ90_000131 [hydrocarbon metagenome]|uniref:Uncharacterized protein n=1 Tax=hydrocarbon metagenome TaxID=938273 RepID=A0A0W8GA85_9ZZZZ